jgi:hypothetical protein
LTFPNHEIGFDNMCICTSSTQIWSFKPNYSLKRL